MTGLFFFRRCLLLMIMGWALAFPMQGQGKCLGGLIDGQWPCEKVELLAHIPNFSTGGMNANDLWGWTDSEDDREYVLLGKRDGTWFVDITDPFMPRLVGSLPTAGGSNSLWRDIKVVGQFMVVVSEVPQSRLQVFDLTELRDHVDIADPFTFEPDTVLAGFSKAHNVAVAEGDSLVFVCGPDPGEGMLIYDFGDGDAPSLIGSWTESYVHDAHIVVYSGPDADHQGKRLAAICAADDVRFLDVTDPSDVFELSSLTIDPHGYVHQGWFSPDQHYFFLGDEGDEGEGLVLETTTYVLDLGDVDNPTLFSAETWGTTATDHNLYCRGPWVHQSNYHDGYRLLKWDSLADDDRLAPRAHFDSQPQLDGPGFGGSWSNYPFFDSGTIAVSDQTEGLFLLRTQFLAGWPEFSLVCPTDTLNLVIKVDSCLTSPLELALPSGVSWMSMSTLPGPGEYTVGFTGFDWSGMGSFTLRGTALGTVHAARFFVNVTSEAQHFPDADGDGYGTYAGAVTGCSPGPGYAHVGGDCDDANANVHPGLPDPCDGVDNDCDQAIDEDGLTVAFYLDLDGDGFAGPTPYVACVLPPEAQFVVGQDCDDLDSTVFPGAEPTLLGVDNDCNGYILGLEQLGGGCPGDLTGDDVVTIGDLLEFFNLYGSTGFFEADLNFDQHVGAADLLLLLSLLGESC